MAFDPGKIKKRREELGWTQQRLSNEWFTRDGGESITTQTISYWESGSKKPTLDHLSKLARVMSVHEGYFFA